MSSTVHQGCHHVLSVYAILKLTLILMNNIRSGLILLLVTPRPLLQHTYPLLRVRPPAFHAFIWQHKGRHSYALCAQLFQAFFPAHTCKLEAALLSLA